MDILMSKTAKKARYNAKIALNAQRLIDYKNGSYERAGGCMELPVPEDAPFFVRDYSEYYKGRAYHKRSLNSNEGWNKLVLCLLSINQFYSIQMKLEVQY